MPPGMRWLSRLLDGLTGRSAIETLCGRARLHYRQYEVRGLYRVEMREQFLVNFDPYAVRFVLTRQQYEVLARGVSYRVYYDSANSANTAIILSLERVLQPCGDDK